MRGRAALLLAATLLLGLGLLAWRWRAPAPSQTLRVIETVASSAPVAAPSQAPLTAASATPPASVVLDAEASLRELDRLSRTDKPRALTLALEDDAKLPGTGVMAEARRALIVTLLVDLDRLSEARARARSFTVAYPDSRYLPLVQGVSGVHPRPRPSQLRDARPRP